MKPPRPSSRLGRLSRAALAACLTITTTARAEAPPPPPENFVTEVPAATVYGNVPGNRTTIAIHSIPGEPRWTIPVWASAFLVAPDAMSILVLGPGHGLLPATDPAQVVATVWYLEGEAVRSRPIRLGEVMDPADMPRMASHFRWLTTMELDPTGYRLGLADGRWITVTFR